MCLACAHQKLCAASLFSWSRTSFFFRDVFEFGRLQLCDVACDHVGPREGKEGREEQEALSDVVDAVRLHAAQLQRGVMRHARAGAHVEGVSVQSCGGRTVAELVFHSVGQSKLQMVFFTKFYSIFFK
jgi:catabolite regulation protein CreA